MNRTTLLATTAIELYLCLAPANAQMKEEKSTPGAATSQPSEKKMSEPRARPPRVQPRRLLSRRARTPRVLEPNPATRQSRTTDRGEADKRRSDLVQGWQSQSSHQRQRVGQHRDTPTRSIRLVALPVSIISIVPEYRSYHYVVV